jgi:hypothetical protein
MLKLKESQCEFQQFLSVSAKDFMELPEDRVPEFDLETPSRMVAIHVLEARPATLLFFQSIMKREPDRFKALNRLFHHAQPGLDGVGWVVTRFAGAVYLSLCIGDEIYIRLIPVKFSTQALVLAKRFDRFMDCSVAIGKTAPDSSAMPLSLAQSLLNQTAQVN